MVKRRGMTLLEVVVAMALVSLILLALYRFLSTSQRYSRETEAYAAAQQQASNVIRALSDELGRSIDRFTKYGSGYVIFLSTEPPEGEDGPAFEFDMDSGRLVWKKWVCYYLSADDRAVFRAEIPLDSPTADLSAEPAPAVIDPTPFSQPDRSRRTVGRGVEDFAVTGATGRAYDFEVTTRYSAPITAESDDYKQVQVTLESRVTMLNEGS